MNLSSTTKTSTFVARHKVKLILAFAGLSMMFATLACLCVGAIAIIGPGSPDYNPPTEYDSYDGQGTAVFVNGIELNPVELHALESVVGTVQPGRYWLDNQGYFGYEGGPAQGNLYALGGQNSSNNGGGYYNSPDGSLYFGSDGDSSYFFDSETGCSVVGGEVSC